MSMQQYCLRWNNHQPNFISVFSSLLNNESLVDVTLAAEGRHLQAHKVVLSACSSYFQSLFTVNPCQHPIVILKDVKFLDLKVIVDFMYYGEVNVSQEQLPHILKTAEMLKIKGLADIPVDQSTLTKSQSSSIERPELLTPCETNWNSDDVQRQSLSPSPCPLSPASKRKRLRKVSTGSGSGSVEKASEEHLTSEVTLTTPGGTNMAGSVIKSDPGGGFQNENNTLIHKPHSNEAELQRGNSNETVEGESSHQITPQVPQQEASTHIDTNPTIDIAGPSTTTHQTTTGYQWGIVDGAYTRFAFSSCHNNVTAPTDTDYTSTILTQCSTSDNSTSTVDTSNISINPQSSSSSPQTLQKRKRSINPQADENFVRALEAVRYGGIGFCKAAKMYGVNNRTLWLEYKKRGYPNNRLSIKNRKQEFGVSNTMDPTSPTPPVSMSDQENDMTPNHTGASTIINSPFIENRQDLGPMFQRPRYLDTININMQHGLSLPGVSFEQM